MNHDQNQLTKVMWEIAGQLGETEKQAISQIRRTIRILGEETARDVLRQTLEVEEQGGMLITDGSRRRTPGGVYFHLLKQRIGQKEFFKIFAHSKTQRRPQAAQSGQPAHAPQPAAPFSLADLPDVLRELVPHYGEASTVKITVIGRPANVVDRGDVVILGLVNDKAPALPKGLPAPPAQTKYVVLVARKQWNKVAEAIKDQADALIIEGYPSYTQQHAGITVFTTNITTKKQQQAKREAQQTAQTQRPA